MNLAVWAVWSLLLFEKDHLIRNKVYHSHHMVMTVFTTFSLSFGSCSFDILPAAPNHTSSWHFCTFFMDIFFWVGVCSLFDPYIHHMRATHNLVFSSYGSSWPVIPDYNSVSASSTTKLLSLSLKRCEGNPLRKCGWQAYFSLNCRFLSVNLLVVSASFNYAATNSLGIYQLYVTEWKNDKRMTSAGIISAW